MRETLHIYLHEPWRTAAEAGEVNLFNRMARALPDWRLRFHADSEGERARAAARGFGLFHMHEPTAPTVLCLRRAYAYPFWRIEATNERWNFDVARADFDPATVPEAARFHAAWRQRLLPGVGSRPEGFLFMPLQGILLRRRSFQSMSPVAMIEAVLAADPRHESAANEMGQTLQLRGRYEAANGLDPTPSFDRAIASYQRALGINPATMFHYSSMTRAARDRAAAQAGRGVDPVPALRAVLRFLHGLPPDARLPARAEATSMIEALVRTYATS